MTHHAHPDPCTGPPDGDALVTVRRDHEAAAMPTALAAARLFAELQGVPATVTVSGDVVCFRASPGCAPAVRARLAELLGEPRFAGWLLDGAVPEAVSGSGPRAGPDPDRPDDGGASAAPLT